MVCNVFFFSMEILVQKKFVHGESYKPLFIQYKHVKEFKKSLFEFVLDQVIRKVLFVLISPSFVVVKFKILLNRSKNMIRSVRSASFEVDKVHLCLV